jgi:hypothetical protein
MYFRTQLPPISTVIGANLMSYHGNFQKSTDYASVRFAAGVRRRLAFGTLITSRKQRQIFSDVTGIPIAVEAPPRTSASLTAFSTAGIDPVTPASPDPFTPIGFFVEGVG